MNRCMNEYQREGASFQASLAQAHHTAFSGLDGEAPPFWGVRSSGSGKSIQLQVAIGRQGADPWVWGKLNRKKLLVDSLCCFCTKHSICVAESPFPHSAVYREGMTFLIYFYTVGHHQYAVLVILVLVLSIAFYFHPPSIKLPCLPLFHPVLFYIFQNNIWQPPGNRLQSTVGYTCRWRESYSSNNTVRHF